MLSTRRRSKSEEAVFHPTHEAKVLLKRPPRINRLEIRKTSGFIFQPSQRKFPATKTDPEGPMIIKFRILLFVRLNVD
ncbi:hypothetical protein TNCV_3613091 [Trichonephila clavipes]|uniref:Uncharacterized protein n=1 Tax=Trichonephila clavipes TaxID=2585209 RepID=A0A8X6VP45_TRICX|nr:hypothetical protein TNCV_3613091 [Trichonephila clavipes]